MLDEQFVAVGDAAEVFGSAASAFGATAPTFIPAEGYTTFRAEYAEIDSDLVFHFFATPEINKLPDPWRYWRESFPDGLQRVATEHFGDGYPRIKAAYSDDLASWWLRASHYDHILDLKEYARRFLAKLDAVLDATTRSPL